MEAPGGHLGWFVKSLKWCGRIRGCYRQVKEKMGGEERLSCLEVAKQGREGVREVVETVR